MIRDQQSLILKLNHIRLTNTEPGQGQTKVSSSVYFLIPIFNSVSDRKCLIENEFDLCMFYSCRRFVNNHGGDLSICKHWDVTP